MPTTTNDNNNNDSSRLSSPLAVTVPVARPVASQRFPRLHA